MARALPPAVLLLLLTACGGGEEADPAAETRVPPALSARFHPPEGWAWGLVRTGSAPAQRYGVTAPPRVPRAAVVVVPRHGEPAEVWFETAADLIDRGFTVWALDRSTAGFAPDAANLRALAGRVIRPPPETPLVILAHADGAVPALRALQTGLKADAAILVSPDIAEREPTPAAGWLARLPTPRKAWSRDLPDDRALGLTSDPWRGAVRMAWQTANPDLRATEPDLAWREAHRAASRNVEAEAGNLRTPLLMLNPDAASAALCARLPDCGTRTIPEAGAALHLETDRRRNLLLAEIRSVALAASVARGGAPSD